MSADQIRGQLDRKRRQRVAADAAAASARAKESKKRAEAAKARQQAARARNELTTRSKLREAERRENEAASAGTEATRAQNNATRYAKEEAKLAAQLAKAERDEQAAAGRRRDRHAREVARGASRDQAAIGRRLELAESTLAVMLRERPSPKPEKLRILVLGASSAGDLRVGREQARIRAAVERALHRDLVELDVRPAATAEDLLDGITKFRPHVVHFSGHSGEQLIEFEDDIDEHHGGIVVSAAAFAAALNATDEPPMLVVLNSCSSAAQLEALNEIVPFGIGMADEVTDVDAINYAAWLYASIANGQSIAAAHRAGVAKLELDGVEGAELPTLRAASGAEPASVKLVEAPPD